MASPRPLWRWHLWCALNWLHVRYRWRWLDWAWQRALAPHWIGDPLDPADVAAYGEGEPF